MPRYKNDANENLHSVHRYLQVKYNKTLAVSDTINLLVNYYVIHEQIEDIKITPGIWSIENTDKNIENTNGNAAL
jgi:hypothetical protein